MIRTLARGFSGLSFFQNRKKKIFGILVFFFLIASIPISVYLVKQQQDIRSRAQETPVVFGNSKVTPGQLSFGSVSKSSPKAVKTLAIESLVSTPSASSGQAPSASSGQAPSASSGQAPSATSSGQAPSATSSGQAPSATPTPTNTQTPPPAPLPSGTGPAGGPSPTTQSAEETSSSQTTYIDSRVGCDVKEGTTPDQICKQRGFLGAPQTLPDYGSTVAQGFWWKQCGGATLTTCTKLDCNIAQLDCTNIPEGGTQQPYPQNYLKVGQAQTLYKPDDLGLDCTSYNPGWTMRVACLEATPSQTPPPAGGSSPSPTTTTTETPSNYSLKLKEQTEGVSLSFSEESFSLKQGEQKTLTITLEINPEILKEDSYTNEFMLTIDSTSYTIPLTFEYQTPLLEKLKDALPGGKEENKEPVKKVSEQEFVPGEVLVKFKGELNLKSKELSAQSFDLDKESVDVSQIDEESLPVSLIELNKKYKLEKVDKIFKGVQVADIATRGTGRINLSKIYKLTFDSNVPVDQIVKDLSLNPEIEYAHPNFIMSAMTLPNDTYLDPDQDGVWSVGAWGQDYEDLWGLKKIVADQAWSIGQGLGVVVAVIDTGVDYNHLDFQGQMWENPGETGTDTERRDKKSNGVDDDNNGFIDDWRGWDFINNDNDPVDDDGHGTHVAGTIAALTNNNRGIAGVAPRAKIMALKFLDAQGSGSLSEAAEAIYYAARNGAMVINASWGANVSSVDAAPTLSQAISYVHDVQDGVFVAAAGNSNLDTANFIPAGYLEAITVSSADHLDRKSDFSNYGLKIDVAAPGGDGSTPSGNQFSNILSLRANNTGSGQLVVGAEYIRYRGTSMATPHVAGVAALLKALHPSWTSEQIRQALRKSSDDIEEVGFDFNTGYGRLNANQAMSSQEPLSVFIKGPFIGERFTANSISIVGTVNGPSLRSWRLEYGSGNQPSSWTIIRSGNSSVISSTLVDWDTSLIPGGSYTIRLNAENSFGGSFEHRTFVAIDKFSITGLLPEQGSFYRSGETISVVGTVAQTNMRNYTIEIRQGGGGSVIPNVNVSVTGGGLSRVYGGVLGGWNTTGIPTSGYDIVVKVTLTDNSIVERSVSVIVDSTIHPGWPRTIYAETLDPFGRYLFHHLTSEDVDGDGKEDLIVGFGRKIHILDGQGNNLPGWPKLIDPQRRNVILQRGPAAGDLDGDGRPEIVAALSDGEVFVWHGNATLMNGWPRYIRGAESASVAIADVDGDGANEIIVPGWYMNVIRPDGSFLPGWPIPITNVTPPAIADMDGDGKKEIVIVGPGDPAHLYILDSRGDVLALQQIGLIEDITVASGPAIGDLDNDGDLEVVVGNGRGRVFAFHHNGGLVSGWPVSFRGINDRWFAPVNGVVIADLDRDGKNEVVATDGMSALASWRGNGVPLFRPVGTGILGGHGFSAPVVVDIDGNGEVEIITINGDNATVWTFSYRNGDIHFVSRKYIRNGLSGFNSPAVGDFDGDGLLELAVLDDGHRFANLFVWDLEGPISRAARPWPMFNQNAAHTGSAVVPGYPFPTVSLEIKIPGIGSGERENRNPQRRDRVTTVKVFDSGRSQVSTSSATLSFDGNNFVGNVNLGNLSSGSYYLTAKLDNSLSKLLSTSPVSITPGTPIATQAATLIMGDVNNDNNINISDFGQLRQCFFKNTQSPEWNTCQASDFNDDGKISVTDYSRLITNFNQRGE